MESYDYNRVYDERKAAVTTMRKIDAALKKDPSISKNGLREEAIGKRGAPMRDGLDLLDSVDRQVAEFSEKPKAQQIEDIIKISKGAGSLLSDIKSQLNRHEANLQEEKMKAIPGLVDIVQETATKLKQHSKSNGRSVSPNTVVASHER